MMKNTPKIMKQNPKSPAQLQRVTFQKYCDLLGLLSQVHAAMGIAIGAMQKKVMMAMRIIPVIVNIVFVSFF